MALALKRKSLTPLSSFIFARKRTTVGPRTAWVATLAQAKQVPLCCQQDTQTLPRSFANTGLQGLLQGLLQTREGLGAVT